jgi:ribosomal-protein-serine acetyltransferase
MLDDFNSLSIPGARIVLRSADLRDVGALFRIICNSHQHLEKWLPWVDFVQTIDDERHIAEQWIYDMQMRAAIHLCITFENEIVGLISTHQIDWMNQRTSIGYWIGSESTGKNFATEATAVLLKYLFDSLKLHRVFIQAATENAASNRVIEKLGFVWEGLLRENERVKDSFLDHNIYGMTRNDFMRLEKIFSPYLEKQFPRDPA